jgi:hypothetical protein
MVLVNILYRGLIPSVGHKIAKAYSHVIAQCYHSFTESIIMVVSLCRLLFYC